MNAVNKQAPERQEIETLLPWHAAGTLNRRDAERVEQALAVDHELKQRYDLVREELAETIHFNETLGAPSARAMEKLFSAIDADSAKAPARRASFDLAGRIVEFIAGFTPRTVAWSAAAAAVFLMLQAAVIGTVIVKQQAGQGGYQTASAPADDSLAMIRFVPRANAAEIGAFLESHRATIVDGPTRTGSYTIRITAPSKAEFTQTIKQMQAKTNVVAFIAAIQ